MLRQALELVSSELNAYLTNGMTMNLVVCDNIARWENKDDNNHNEPMEGKVVLTLVGIEEENHLAQPNYTTRNPNTQETTYKNPPVKFNSYWLFTMNRENYLDAMDSLSGVIRFFQGKSHFSSNDFELFFKLHAPTFEEANHLWAMLGGKQIPYIMYKVRLFELERSMPANAVPPVQQVQILDVDFI